ncbi:MAG: ACP phosphodiesterase [Saprospiraceae bacterium]|nr:MAG: ACP phosphodiesterase [Saprospiraceae bacterium]
MNFLAHLFLSCEREALLVGNFLADFIRNKDVQKFPAEIQEGILLHRQIDHFTDVHPLVLQGVRRMYADHHKYAPVIIDVFYDYFLSQAWHEYSEEPLREFSHRIYEILKRNLELMPPALQKNMLLMIQDDWLMNYGTLSGLEFTFSRMARRVSRPAHLKGVIQSLQKDEDLLAEEFAGFFPDVIKMTQDFCGC